QRDSCERREDFRQYGTLSDSSHIQPGTQNALTNRFADSFMRFSFSSDRRECGSRKLVPAKLEKISIAVNWSLPPSGCGVSRFFLACQLPMPFRSPTGSLGSGRSPSSRIVTHGRALFGISAR